MTKSSRIPTGLRRKPTQPSTALGDRDGTISAGEDSSDEIEILLEKIGLIGDVATRVGDAFRRMSLLKIDAIEKVFRGRFQKHQAENWIKLLLGEDQTCLAVTVSELLADHFKLGKRDNYCMITISWKRCCYRRLLRGELCSWNSLPGLFMDQYRMPLSSRQP